MPVILPIWEAEIRMIVVQGQPRQKVSKSYISTNKKLDVVVCVCYPSYMGSINRRIKCEILFEK
jgi:hypothetical protein